MPPDTASPAWSASSVAQQPTLFSSDDERPPGFHYRAAVISEDEARALVHDIERLEFSRVEMRGVVARRRTAHFGVTYGYERRTSQPGTPVPAFLLPLRARVAEWAGIDPAALVEALVTEYPPGASIGWHRDAPMFGDVIAGISLLSACRMKFRPYVSPSNVRDLEGPRRTTHEIDLPPRSGYLITALARREFEHSIPPTAALRYSITFRNLK
jgi:alkylated DNA repair dioxygenase AlkB